LSIGIDSIVGSSVLYSTKNNSAVFFYRLTFTKYMKVLL